MEPLTAITDAILAAWTAFLCALLFARANGRRSVILWACGFAATTLGTLAGAAWHAWRVSWALIPITMGAATFFLGAAIATAWLAPRARHIVIALLGVELVACVVAGTMSDSFVVVAADYGPVLVVILIGAIAHRAHFITAGIVVSFVALGIEASSLRLGALDHNDLFHVVQMLAMFFLYRGGALIP